MAEPDPFNAALERIDASRISTNRAGIPRMLKTMALGALLGAGAVAAALTLGGYHHGASKAGPSPGLLLGLSAAEALVIVVLAARVFRGGFRLNPLWAEDRAVRRSVMRSLRRGEAAPDAQLAMRALDASVVFRRGQPWLGVLAMLLSLNSLLQLVYGSSPVSVMSASTMVIWLGLAFYLFWLNRQSARADRANRGLLEGVSQQ